MMSLSKSNNIYETAVELANTKSYRNKLKLKIIVFFVIFIAFLILAVKTKTLHDKYNSYNAGIDFLKSNKYVDAVNKFAMARDYRDASDKLKAASKHIFGQLDDCLKQIGMEMVVCPAGSYEEIKKKNNSIFQNTITISRPFAIGKYEVTFAQYLLIMGKHVQITDNYLKPVNNITWIEAKEFCEKLNKMFANKLPEDYKFDLPTDSQWEYACRAGKNSKFYVGPTEGNIDEVAWIRSNSKDIQLIGQKKPNDWGIYDMYGNVWEWCKNTCEKCSSRLANATDSAEINQTSCRISRGGSYNSKANEIIAYDTPSSRNLNAGFRLAFVPISL